MNDVKKPVDLTESSIVITKGLHPIAWHKFWIDRNGKYGCPYCGPDPDNPRSKPVHKSVILESLKVRKVFIGIKEG